VFRRIPDRNIWVIYAVIVLLGIAYGTSISVLAVHLDAHEIPKLAMGGLAAAFALGIVCFAIPTGWIVHRFGAKWTLAAALAGYAVCVTSFPFLSTLFGLSVARFFDGAFSVGVWVSAETALLARSDKNNKGLVMSVYAISLALGYVVGPFVASFVVRVYSTGPAFLVAGGLAVVAILVVLFALEGEPKGQSGVDAHGAAEPGDAGDALLEAAPPMTVPAILWRTKTSCFATFTYGYFQASVVLFMPLYLVAAKNIPVDQTILITAFFAAGMLLLSSWAGRLGDRHGHLLVMRVLGAIGGVTVASFVLMPSFALMAAAVFVAGASLASISPVSLALQGVVVPRKDLSRANGFYNATYATGMLLGPPVSGLLFTRYGGATMLFHLAALWAGFVLLTLLFAADDPRHASSDPALRAMLR
jgi:MFS family permease